MKKLELCNNIICNSLDINISVIKDIFTDYLNHKMWVICGSDKIPVDPKSLFHLKWSDTEKYMVFSELEKWLKVYDNFGLFTGIYNVDINNNPYPSVRCLDLDDVLENGEVKNPKIIDFLDRLNTFVEISTSGKGLHAFVITDADISEFSFNEEKYWKGKYYSQKHFIKLTGNVFKNYKNPLQCVSRLDLLKLKEIIGVSSAIIIPSSKSGFKNDKSWDQILTDAGIDHFETTYTGKESPTTKKICIESWKIECPNVVNHATLRPGDKSANLAVLQKWDDGTSSIKCNHHACEAKNNPNLLKKLWDNIHEKKTDKILAQMGWN